MSRPARLGAREAEDRLASLKGWSIEGDTLVKTFAFKDYHHTMVFVNAVAWIAHRADHHPDLAVGYNRCRIAWSTHDAGGLTEFDFACAAQCDALIDG
ncbi:MAG: 4a-hydroxytetrahydrobiopterin dehydratase [Betaproteobacteria bacterium]|nr:4a-hydroxytetrahydrobiopterin dehydratase [Betaproteobacteria bacterium]